MSGLWVDLSFRQPLWLLLTLQPLFILWLSRWINTRQSSQYCEPHLQPWVISQPSTDKKSHYIRAGFLLLAWLALAIAIAGPRLPESVLDSHDTTQRELIVLLDVSASMSARDILPNRLERAKLELLDLIDRMQATRMGIVVYAARSHLLSPLTNDKTVLRHYISTLKPNMLPTQGSQLQHALRYTATYFSPQNTTPRAILIISDGEIVQAQTAIEETIQQLKQQHIEIYALGIGTRYGAPIVDSNNGWLEYEGQAVTSVLHRERLQKFAQLGNGQYAEIHDGNLEWQTLYDNGIARLRPINQTLSSQMVIWHELYPWFLLSALMCLILALWQPRAHKGVHTLVLAIIFLFSQGISNDVFASSSKYATAYTNLTTENFQQARQQFSVLPGYAARLGEGTAAYRMQRYKIAAQQFTQAMLDADSDHQRAHALFNLANCKYQLDEYFIAAGLYQDVLKYWPDHLAAKTNRSYALALQEEHQQENKLVRRAGSGPQTGQLLENQVLTGGKLSLGKDNEKAQFILPDISTSDRLSSKQALLNARPASRKIDTQNDQGWDYRINHLDQLQQANPFITNNEAQFWQRLYELEEGFMAPVESPHPLPGVKPW